MYVIVDLHALGQEDYPVVREAYYKGGEGFLLMFAINDLDSFTALEDFHDQILTVKGSSKPVPFLLVGNKVDLEDFRTVSTTEAHNCASKWNCPYIETSAKTRVNVDESFVNLFNHIYAAKKPTDPEPQPAKVNEKRCCSII